MKIGKIVFMGTPDFAAGTLKALLDAGRPVQAVITQPDKPRGRSGKLQPTPVKELAEACGIPVYQPKKVREPQTVELIRSLAPDLIVVAAFGQIIPKDILEIPPLGCINVHASLLPMYRGAAPVQWAILDGQKETGVTIMRMDVGLDTGDMISKEVVPIEEKETGGSLFDKLCEAGGKLLVDTLPSLEDGTATFTPQPEQSPTAYARMLTKEMGRIDWSRPAVEIERQVRGLSPWPTAYTTLRGRQLKIWEAVLKEPAGAFEADNGSAGGAAGSVMGGSAGGAAGSVMGGTADAAEGSGTCAQQTPAYRPGQIAAVRKDSFSVQTGEGLLWITELQLEGKKRMPADAFLRGFTPEEAEVLGE